MEQKPEDSNIKTQKEVQRKMLARIILDSGGFLPRKDRYIDVGYFESDSILDADIKVYEDGTELALPAKCDKLGRGLITVQHLVNGAPKTGIRELASFRKDLLHVRELFTSDPYPPEFDDTVFHCTLRFETGDFSSQVVKRHRFLETEVSSGKHTGKDLWSRPIAHDVAVDFELAKGDSLKLTRNDGSLVWSTDQLTTDDPARVEIHIVADSSTVDNFYRCALKCKGNYCWIPNNDPPPVGAP